MKIILAGDGEVGFYLAKLLEEEYQDITLIDTQQDKLEHVEKELGIATILGDSTSYKVLIEAGIAHADLLIAVTSNESVNITTCLIGKKLGAKYTIARINNMEYLIDKKTLDLKKLGIDDLISPESLACREIKHILKSPVLTETFDIHEGMLNIKGMFIDHNSPLINKTLGEATRDFPEKNFIIAAIRRGNGTIIPKGDTIFKKGDHIYFVTTRVDADCVFQFTGNQNYEIKNVLVVGGSRTGKYIALKLSEQYNIKLIDKSLEKCNYLAKNIPQVHIVCGDGTDIKLLETEKIYDYDAIISVTGNSETNIFTCLIAKEFGVKKTIALVENIGLFDYSHRLGIDTLINKKLAASNFIFRKIHKSVTFSHLYGVNAEILELSVKKNSKASKRPISELGFPEGAVISGIIRNGQGYLAHGDLQLQDNDKVLIFSLPDNSKLVKSFFN
ncbi:MAG: Trk system potassium transporter TrkA [Prolixibacteraceae bacterium]|nr:Trk system potassium transporter TrkA [Prolixibacteraceae bacterium]